MKNSEQPPQKQATTESHDSKHSHKEVQQQEIKTPLLADQQEQNANAKYVIQNETIEKRELETPKAGVNPGTRTM